MATIRKRGDAWNVQIRRRGHETRSATFDTKVAAEAWARSVETEMDKGEFVPVQTVRDVTVASIFQRYAEEISPTKKGSRWEITRINLLLRSASFVKKPLPSLTASDLQTWRDKRLKEVSAGSVNRELNIISAIFTHAIKEWKLPLRMNPVRLVMRPKNPRNRTQRWSDDDLKKIADHCDYQEGTLPRTLKGWVPHILYLAVETAMRKGEIFDIQIENIHLDKKFLVLKDTKNGDARNVPLSAAAVRILTLLINDRETGSLVPYAKGSFDMMFSEARHKLDLMHLRFHDARREAATRISKKLSNVLELSAVTGHRDLRSLKVYYQPDPTDIANKL